MVQPIQYQVPVADPFAGLMQGLKLGATVQDLQVTQQQRMLQQEQMRQQMMLTQKMTSQPVNHRKMIRQQAIIQMQTRYMPPLKMLKIP